ncbi:MAG: hypothetical protein ABI851_08945 [Saprospiraceae bacterium]
MITNLFNSVEIAERNALLWLVESHKRSCEKGFAHSRINFLPSKIAWRKAYPETSGYLIENFLKFNTGIIKEDQEIGLKTANWLTNIQSKDGFYYSGVENKIPSTFNTAQIIFGLLEAYQFTKNTVYFFALEKAKKWLLDSISDEGVVIRGLYKPNYFASYYTRALWPLLLISDDREKKFIGKAVNSLWKNKNKYKSFDRLGFNESDYCLTHTIAYAIEGFIECSILVCNKEMLDECDEILEYIADMIINTKRLDGIYNSRWETISTMKCLTGQAQFASLFAKAHLRTRSAKFEKVSVDLLKELVSWQIKSNNSEHHGAFPASLPTYSRYFPFQYINWTNKFFLDACYQAKKFI